MRAPLLTRKNASHYQDRVARVNQETTRRWGKLNQGTMLAHLNKCFEASLGEFAVPDTSNFISRTLIRWLIFHVLPWPKGKAKSPEAVYPPQEANLEAERKKLLGALERFLEAAEKEPQRTSNHPIVGPVTLEYCRRIHALHMDHHLRQFGV